MSKTVALPEGYIGHIDDLDSRYLRGWLINLNSASSPIPLQLRSAGTVVFRGATGNRRPDLEAINYLYRAGGIVIDVEEIDFSQVSENSFELWVEDNTQLPEFKAFAFTLSDTFVEAQKAKSHYRIDERKFSARTIFKEDPQLIFEAFINPDTVEGPAAHYKHHLAPRWPLAVSDLYFDLAGRSPRTGERLIDLLEQSTTVETGDLFDIVAATKSNVGFDNGYYLEAYPDVAAGLNPVLHFLLFGRNEGRIHKYASLKQHPLETSFFSSFFESLYTTKKPTKTYPRAIEHVFQTIRKGLHGSSFWGNEEIETNQKFFSFLRDFQIGSTELEEDIYAAATDYISSNFLTKSDTDYAPISESIAHSFNHSAVQLPVPPEVASPEASGVTIITSYYRHLDYFSQAASSVAATIASTKRIIPWMKIEWLIVNDDPAVTADALLERVPREARDHVRIIDNEKNSGIVYSNNKALSEAKFDWIVFLDCDDMLFPACLLILDYYFKAAPARYYSSRCIDIGPSNELLRYRQRHFRQTDEISSGLQAGHLKMVHKSIFSDVGEFPIYSEGCQDLWLALEVCKRERIVYLSEYLYYYRWHLATQSSSGAQSQEATTRRVKKCALSSINARNNLPSFLTRPGTEPKERLHGVVVRTTGDRIYELKEAIHSCTPLNDVRIEVVVVVHGGEDQVAFVRDSIADVHSRNYTILPAYDGVSKRGYPLNVGIDYLLKMGAESVSILDDDDIYLQPLFFAAQMVIDAARMDGQRSDIAIGQALLKDGSGVRLQHKLRASSTIFDSNFITTNSIVISRLAAERCIAEFGAIFPTDMHYLEDWVGFMRLIASGAHAIYLDSFVGQYTGGSDGNVDFKLLPVEHQKCVSKAQYEANRLRAIWASSQTMPSDTPLTFRAN
jgi:glycosyltransferase involved in cell wall biosynthesis